MFTPRNFITCFEHHANTLSELIVKTFNTVYYILKWAANVEMSFLVICKYFIHCIS